jgi:hypothetical protein
MSMTYRILEIKELLDVKTMKRNLKLKKAIFIVFIIYADIVFSQNYILPKTLVIEKNNLSQKHIKEQLVLFKNNNEFKTEDYFKIENTIYNCNLLVNEKLKHCDLEFENYNNKKKDLIRYGDIKKLKEQILELEKSKEKIKIQLDNELENVNIKGLFLFFVQGMNPYEKPSDPEINSIAIREISPIAIEDLNGIFINSFTEIFKSEKSSLYQKYIIAKVSGVLKIEEVRFSQFVNKFSGFFIIVKCNVSPLKSNIITSNKIYNNLQKKYTVVNLLKCDSIYEKISMFDLSDNDISIINSYIKSNLEIINHENLISKEDQKRIIRYTNQKLEEIEEEILLLQKKLDFKIFNIKQIINTNSEIKYSLNNIEDAIENTLKFFNIKLKENRLEYYSIKENELVSVYDVKITSHNDFNDDISNQTLEILENIKEKYSFVEEYLKEQVMYNSEMTLNNEGLTKKKYREIEKIWLYIIPDNGVYRITVVAKFNFIAKLKITDKDKFNLICSKESFVKNDLIGLTEGLISLSYNLQNIEDEITSSYLDEIPRGDYYIKSDYRDKKSFRKVINVTFNKNSLLRVQSVKDSNSNSQTTELTRIIFSNVLYGLNSFDTLQYYKSCNISEQTQNFKFIFNNIEILEPFEKIAVGHIYDLLFNVVYSNELLDSTKNNIKFCQSNQSIKENLVDKINKFGSIYDKEKFNNCVNKVLGKYN